MMKSHLGLNLGSPFYFLRIPGHVFKPYTLIAPAIKLRFDDDDDNMAHPED